MKISKLRVYNLNACLKFVLSVPWTGVIADIIWCKMLVIAVSLPVVGIQCDSVIRAQRLIFSRCK